MKIEACLGYVLGIVIATLVSSAFSSAYSQSVGFSDVDDISNILPVRARVAYVNEVIESRIAHLLPGMMQRHGIDLWFVIDRENNKDPVSVTLFNHRAPQFTGQSVILHNEGNGKGIRRYRGGIARLKTLIEELNPKSIGINTSDLWNNGDGLTKGLYDRLVSSLGSSEDRLVSA